jgi:hypothetical protein
MSLTLQRLWLLDALKGEERGVADRWTPNRPAMPQRSWGATDQDPSSPKDKISRTGRHLYPRPGNHPWQGERLTSEASAGDAAPSGYQRRHGESTFRP